MKILSIGLILFLFIGDLFALECNVNCQSELLVKTQHQLKNGGNHDCCSKKEKKSNHTKRNDCHSGPCLAENSNINFENKIFETVQMPIVHFSDNSKELFLDIDSPKSILIRLPYRFLPTKKLAIFILLKKLILPA